MTDEKKDTKKEKKEKKTDEEYRISSTDDWLKDILERCNVFPFKICASSDTPFTDAILRDMFEREKAEKEKKDDANINHPSHYVEGRKYEPIEVIEDWRLGFNLGNAVKYISRAGRKDDRLQDLKKARWYLDREIQRMEKGE